jgi:hypothetical protein
MRWNHETAWTRIQTRDTMPISNGNVSFIQYDFYASISIIQDAIYYHLEVF